MSGPIRRLLQVEGGPGGPPPSLAGVTRWFTTLAGGRLRIETEAVAPWPAVARAALLGRPEMVRDAIGAAAARHGPPLLLLGPPMVRPHCWRMASGRAYAVAPRDAPAALMAHELGHLLFGWPDLRLPPGSGIACLMAPLEQGRLAEPCAPMRIMAGWEEAEPLPYDAPARDLPERRSYRWADLLVERQRSTLACFRLRGRLVTLAGALPCGSGSALAQVSGAFALGWR